MSRQPTNPEPDGTRPVVVDLRVGARKTLVVVSGACGTFGLIALIVGHGSSRAAGAGVLLLILAALPLVFYRRLTRTRILVLGPNGLRWHEPSGTSWQLHWQELRAVELTVHKYVEYYREESGHSSPRVIPAYWLDLVPRDQQTTTRHPELAPLWNVQHGYGMYRIDETIAKSNIPGLDRALRAFAPSLYNGVSKTGEGWLIDAPPTL